MEEISRRSIPLALVEEVFASPGQVVDALGGRKAYQSKVIFPDGRTFLLRVIVDERVTPPAIVTVYRTSKFEKYWRKQG